METLLHYVWKHRLYVPGAFKTEEGIALEIIDPGMYNQDAGPDFFNAKIKLDDKLWAGNVEIHTLASDWYKHKHDSDKAYNSVVLHVVEEPDETPVRDQSGRLIPQWILRVPEHIRENYLYLLHKDEAIPCLSRIHEVPEIYLTDWQNALSAERLERKTNGIFQLLHDYQDDWNAVFYIVLARHFGFGINNDAFERLAKSLPFKYILKHSDSEKQVEALFLGQAGLLDDEIPNDDYYLFLQREYQFLSKKYGLHSLDASIFKSLRIRPANFPHIKLVQLAGFITKEQSLFSQILEKEHLKDFQSLFFSNVSEYWETHYHFGKESVKRKKGLGISAINILLINTVVPVLFAYGKKKGQEIFLKKAFDLLEALPPENNFIVNAFTRAGIKAGHAGDSQALIQLKREYCEPRKCIFCRIGHRLLQKK
ncbi:hypothetical protein FACS189421_09560 [Bacteroidia bacterium]|nr:hypothetical protein FACS189421_09560 [Bacteroidia bacterium]GHT05825.1 hypothetical protein FACS189423_10400 [Bacteroidia bacterium]